MNFQRDRMRDRSGIAGAINDDGAPYAPSQHLATIWPLIGRHIAFHRRLVDVTSSVKAALLLSQVIYWTRHGKDIARTEGWFMKTAEQWAMETGLSEREQATVRGTLRRKEILVERRVGLPARLHFRLDTERLSALLACHIGMSRVRIDWADGAIVGQLLGPALAYHRALMRVGKGVHAGLLLSRALYLTRVQTARQADGWIRRTSLQWTDDLGLSRREQETARRKLMELGVWEEGVLGFPPRLAIRIRLESLLARLVESAPMTVRPWTSAAAPDRDDLATSRAQNVGSSRRDSPDPVPSKPPIQFGRMRQHGSDETAKFLEQGSTSVSVQPLTLSRESEGLALPPGGELIFPEQLQPAERDAARVLIEHCGSQGQALLDELAARMYANAVRSTPIAYLRGLVARATAGTFVPEAGLRIAAGRRRSVEEELERREHAQAAQRLAEEHASPEYRAKIATRREEMRQWLDSQKAGKQGGCRS
jgi:hypothetical protein